MMLCLPNIYVEIQIMPGQLLKLLLWAAKERFQLYSEVKHCREIFNLPNIQQKGGSLHTWYANLKTNYSVYIIPRKTRML